MKRWWLFAIAVAVLTALVSLWPKADLGNPSGTPGRKPPRPFVMVTNALDTVAVGVLGRTNLTDGRAGVVLGISNNSRLFSFRYFCQAEVKSNGVWHSVTGWDPNELSANDLKPEKALQWTVAHPEGASVWRVRFFGVRVFANQTLHKATIELDRAGVIPGPRESFMEFSSEIDAASHTEGRKE